jgi:hypothetical protein
MLDIFLDEWAASSDSVPARLAAAFERSRQRFAAEAPALITDDADFPGDPPAAVLLAVASEGTAVHAAWIGGDVAIVTRGFRSVGETTPHTLRERFKRENPTPSADLSEVPNVLLRTMGPRSADDDPPGVAVFEVEASDTILLLSKAIFRGPCVPIEEAAFAAAIHTSPAVLAERLVELAFGNQDAPYAAVAVLRFDSIDVAVEIDRLIDDYEPDPRHGAWLGDWAREQRALPVSFDMGGAFGMRRDGSVLSVSWDDPSGSTREERSPVAHAAATLGASRTYAALKTLGPRRPSLAEPCTACTSFGPNAGERGGCPVCLYLGWRPRRCGFVARDG